MCYTWNTVTILSQILSTITWKRQERSTEMTHHSPRKRFHPNHSSRVWRATRTIPHPVCRGNKFPPNLQSQLVITYLNLNHSPLSPPPLLPSSPDRFPPYRMSFKNFPLRPSTFGHYFVKMQHGMACAVVCLLRFSARHLSYTYSILANGQQHLC